MKTKKKTKRESRHIALRPSIKGEVAQVSKRTGIPQSKLLEQGWELRKKQL